MRVWRPLAKKPTANERKEHNVEKYLQLLTTLSPTILVYLNSFSCCCVRNLRNSLKIWTYRPTVQVFNFQGPRYQQHPWFSGYQHQQMFSGTFIEERAIETFILREDYHWLESSNDIVDAPSTEAFRERLALSLANIQPESAHPFLIMSTSFCLLSSWLRLVHLILRISPHLTHHLRSHHLSLPLPFTPDLKLISFKNPFLHSHSFSFRTFTDLNLYWIEEALLCLFQFLATCARLSWILSFRVHVKLWYRMYRIIQSCS